MADSPVYRPSELLAFLSSLGVQPRKGLSQNFLIDGNILRNTLSTADVQKGDLILEIGPGPGALTQLLLQAGARVIAVEKDRILAKALERFQTEDFRLQVYEEDILQFDWKRIEEQLKGKEKAKVVANLPYHLTTPILSQLVKMPYLFSKIIVMVQEEVAARFVAKPGTKEYGSFTVYLKFYSEPSYAFKVGRRSFYPAPKVDSAVVVLTLKNRTLLQNEESLFKLTRKAFQQRRKMLRSSLSTLASSDRLQEAFAKIGLSSTARAEELSLDQFIALWRALFDKEPDS